MCGTADCLSGSRCVGVTLVDELVEGVLPVGPRLAPHNRSGVVIDAGAVFGDVFPVGLHVALAKAGTQLVTVREAAATQTC